MPCSQFDLPDISLGAIAQVGGAVLGGVGAALPLVLIVALLAAIGFGLWQGLRRWRAVRKRRYHHDPVRRRIFAEYRKAQRALRIRRDDAQTLHEQAQQHPQLDQIARATQEAAYRPAPPAPTLLDHVRELRRRLRRQT